MIARRKKTSGEHPAVQGFRRKLASVADTTIPALEAFNDRLDRVARKSRPPPKDPRREDDEPIPVDTVDLDPDPDDPGP